MKSYFFLLLSVLLIGCNHKSQPSHNSDDFQAFRDSVESIIERHHETIKNSGIAIAAICEGSLILNEGYGKANIEEAVPVSSKTVFNLASISKSVTAIGLLRLLKQKGISINTPVNDVLSEWKLPSTNGYKAEEVTIQRLLNHKAGISLSSAPIVDADSSISGLNNILNSGDIRIMYEPGQQWQYSGGGYIILQKMIEELSGMGFADYMNQEMFSLYSLNSATFHQETIQDISRLALPYDGDKIVDPYKIYGSSAGGLFISMNDFVGYMTLYFQSKNQKNSLITDYIINLIKTDTVKVNLKGVDGAFYGLGHGVHVTDEDQLILYHSGGNPGYLAYFLVMPQQQNAMAIFANNSANIAVLIELLNFWSSYFDINIQPVY